MAGLFNFWLAKTITISEFFRSFILANLNDSLKCE